MRIRSSHLIAGGVALALAGWLASGHLGGGPQADAPDRPIAAEAEQRERPRAEVRVRESRAEPVAREIVVNGETAAARVVELRAETNGRVVALGPARGEAVAPDQVLLTLDPRERTAMVEEAEAMLRLRQIQHEAAQRLGEKGFQAETGVAEARANLQAAEAVLERTRLDLEHTRIRASFAGVLEARPLEIGDYVDMGDPVARVIELDPLIVVGHVTERDVGRLRIGMDATARLVGGAELEGRLRYVASESHPETRTFKVEVEIDNPDRRHAAGLSAELRLAYADALAHRVPGSALVLSDEGRLGVKTVNAAGVVIFHAAEIVDSDAEAVWLAGLPERVRVITVGQGFVRAGDEVVPVPEGAIEDDAPLVAERRR